jgi:hypothetical protein
LRLAAGAFLACVVLATSGCAGRRAAARAQQAVGEPVLLELESQGTGPLRIRVEHFVARNDPGSFTRDARWDEYRLALSNEGGAPLVLEGLDRVAADGAPVSTSASAQDLSAKTALVQGLIAAGTVKTAAAAAGAAGAVGTAGSFYSAVGLSTLGGALTAVSVMMVPAAIVGGVAIMASQARRADRETAAVEQGFARALKPPVEVAAGETLRASAFFPIMPTSTMLVARYRVGGEPRSAAVYLARWRAEENLLASGCELASVLAQAPPVEDRALATAQDAEISATIESVILRGSHESWAEDAHWDEYRVRVRAMGVTPVHVTAVRLVDAQGRVTEANRPLCPDGQPLLAAAHAPLRTEIARRLTPLPATVAPAQEAMLDLFFSMSPPPVRAEIDYTHARGYGMLRVDTLPIFQATTP